MMQLYSWPTSPFGAKVKATIYALKLERKVEIINYHPWQNDPVLRSLNPLNKIPVLVTDEGNPLYDSPVICEYLNDLAKGNLIPQARKYEILRIQALCDGILDAAVNARYEMHFRPENLRSKDWIDRQLQAVKQGLQSLAIVKYPEDLDLSVISVVTTLLYLKLRYPEIYLSTPKAFTDFLLQWSENPVFVKSQPLDNLALPENLNKLMK